MSHNAPLCNRNVHTCAHFCYKVVLCGIYAWCIVGFVRRIYAMQPYNRTFSGSQPLNQIITKYLKYKSALGKLSTYLFTTQQHHQKNNTKKTPIYSNSSTNRGILNRNGSWKIKLCWYKSLLKSQNQVCHLHEYDLVLNGLTHLPLEKWPPFRRRHFYMHFHEWKVLYFDSNFTEVCSWGSNWQLDRSDDAIV